jgi:predicted CoA-binding protein
MKTVAVIGASSDRRKFGNRAFRAYREEGYKVIPINPNETSVEGVSTYPTVMDVPEKIDMATVYVPPEIGITLLEGFERKQIAEIWINPGAESDDLIAEARRRKLNVIEACSIVGIGRNPYSL